ncbi:P-loop containing nucleoside triphosphate hydrolase protein, partial [Schizophyllum commune Loenen D]
DWLEEQLCAAAGTSELRPFQRDLGYEIAVLRHDVFCTIAPGAGKSLLLLSGPLAAKARGESGIAVLVVPTKALAEQQALSAGKYGLRSLAINEDSLRENPDLARELQQGRDIRVAVVSPQMLLLGLKRLLSTDLVRSGSLCDYAHVTYTFKIRWMLIDEAHLVDDEGTVFREHYRLLGNLRSVLKSKPIWVAVSGSVLESRRDATTGKLGFHPGYFVNARYSQDIPRVKIISRFLRHATTQGSFLDLSWLVPRSARTLADIPQAIVFVSTITQDGLALERFLDKLVKICMPNAPNRRNAIRQYNSMLTPQQRGDWADDFCNGKIRIGVVTESLTYGLDLDIPTVVSLGLVQSSNISTQRRGRTGRRGPGKFVLYSPEWVEIVEETKAETATARENRKKRAAMDPDILAYCNPTPQRCSRAVALALYGDTRVGSEADCLCETHQPGDNAKDYALVDDWVTTFKNLEAKRAPVIRSDGTYRALKSAAQKATLTTMLNKWRVQTWYALEPCSPHPAGVFLPDCVVRDFVDKAHVCAQSYSAFEKVASVIRWKHAEAHGQLLFQFLQQAMEELKEDAEEVV